MDYKDLILKHALQNAVKYNGKASIGAVIGKVLQEKPELKSKIGEISKQINVIVNGINKLTVKEQEEKLKSMAPELLEKKHEEKKELLPELSNVKGKPVLRLAPYPSGPLHIGNAYPYIVNDYYAKRYKGNLLLVIDDTIGSKEKDISKDAYKLIPEGLKWLGIKFSKIYYKSDRLSIYYKYAEELIKKDKAYVCFCSQEELRENRYRKLDARKQSTNDLSPSEEQELLALQKKEGVETIR